MHRVRAFAKITLMAGAVALIAGPAVAQSVADFYRGKTIVMIVQSAPGGIEDFTGRLVARYMVKYLPGHPAFIAKNDLGARGIAGLNVLYNVTPKDGATIAIVERSAAQTRALGEANVHYDPEKFIWLGSTSSFADDAYGLMVMSDRPYRTWEDLKNSKRKAIFGAVRAGSTNLTFALFAKDVLKLNIDVIRGYSSAAKTFLAMEEGELDGQAIGLSAAKIRAATLWNTGKLRVLIQFARESRHPSLPDVPTGRELLTNADDVALLEYAEAPFHMALPFLAPPGVPADRAKALQDAFMKANDDPEFRAEAKKRNLEVSPISGADVARLVMSINRAPQSIVDRFRKIAGLRK